eukprot:s825_g17.t1
MLLFFQIVQVGTALMLPWANVEEFSTIHRWGEALHPGPPTSDDGLLWISFTNPSGLRNKESTALEVGTGILNLSETHLSWQTQKSCAARLRHLALAQHRNLRIHLGGPVAVRSNSTWAGTWSGVATLSDLPSYEVSLPYNGERACGRLLCTRHSFGSSSLLNVVAYGYPAGPSWPQSKQLTTDLLEVVTKEVVLGAQGPRIIGGDMNADPSQLPIFDYWRSQGWCSAQDYALAAWGQSKTFTCKGATETDHAWLSPEAQALCHQVAVHDHFMEHSTVAVGLHVPCETLTLWTWPRPSALPYDELDPQWCQHVTPPQWDDSASVDDQWAQLAATFESCFDGFVPAQPAASLTAGQKGRLQRRRPIKRQCHTVTLRASRPGEVAMRSQLLGQETRHWFRQLRRIQSYHHAIKAAKLTASALAYRLELWSSILQAPGFVGGFAVWWSQTTSCHSDGLFRLPSAPPGLEVATSIFLNFKTAYERLESWHLRQRGKLLKAKYETGMKGIHQDLRKIPRDRIDSLQYTFTYGILAVEDNQVHVDRPIPTGGFSLWKHEDITLQVSHINEVVLTVDHEVAVGDVLTQHQHFTKITEVHQALLDYWTPIWNAMPTVPDADWQRITAFFQAYVPKIPFQLPDITVSQWHRALKRFKPAAARGVDGFSHLDLLAMPTAWTERLLCLLKKIELGTTSWPVALLYGVVSVIAKDPCSKTVDRFRPIVVFSVIYRTWASIRSRQLLRQISPYMDAGAYGFLPDMTGLSTDLVRAFNNIPRQHSFALATHLGVPDTLITPWRAFLTNCTRAFDVQGWHSSTTTSCCGLPEGDALSVYAMVQLNMAWHLYMRAFCPQVRTLSFVDNLALVTTAVDLLVQGLASLVEFFRLWNLAVDQAKSYCWALNTAMRRQLTALPFRQVTSALELGGVLSFTKRQFTGQQHQKFLALESRWLALQHSWAPLRQKLAVLPLTFWASALHGIYGACFGEIHIDKLRSKAIAALRLRRAGANPLLRLSLSSTPTADPGLWRAMYTLRALRRLAQKEPRLLTNWKFFMTHFEGDLMSGPFSQVLVVADQLQWMIQPPFVVDHDGFHHHLTHTEADVWDSLVLDAWYQHVARQVQRRPTMSDLTGLDPAAVHALHRSATALDMARLSALHSGCFMSNAQHAKYDLTKTARCLACDVPDDLLHWLVCPRHANIRQEIPKWQDRTQHDTTALRMHLLPSRSPFARPWKQALLQLDDLSGTFLFPSKYQHATCVYRWNSHQDWHSFDIAAWGSLNATTGLAIAAGPVPGLNQTSARAELFAALSALKWQNRHQVDMTLWVDAKFLSDGIEYIQLHGEAGDWSHSDLWFLIAEQIQLLTTALVPRWIPSHLDPTLLECPFEEWAHLWNDRIDRLVARVNHERPSTFLHLWHAARRHFTEVTDRLRQLSAFYGQAAAAPKAHFVDLTEDVQHFSDMHTTLHDLYTDEFVAHLSTLSDTSAVSVSFLVSVLRWLIASFDDDADCDRVYPLSYEELALLLANQPGFQFPFWNGATQRMECGGDKAPKVAAVKDANTMACVVLAGCHSLIEVESKLLGDPIEVAALRSIAWSYQPSSSTASPSNWRAKEITIARQKEYMAGLKDDIESDKKEKEEVSKKIQDLEKSLKADKVEAGKMSTICKVTCATDKCQSGVYGLVKGSPEAIAKLLKEKPSWYDSAYKSMAEQGQRVLALAYTRIVDTSDLGNKPREEVESHLTFAGFIAFKCETRKDSMLVIRSLQDSSHACVMLTGDAPLTALSVAVEVGIAQFSPNNALVLTEVGEDGLEWRPAITSGGNGDKVEPVKFEAAGIRKLGESRDLIITGGPLERAWQQADTQTMQAQLSSVKIFARLSPFQKEQIIQAVRKSEKSYSFMCGDGGNDVGALKEADVGLALLSGFGNANVDAKNQEEQKADVGKAEDALEAVRKENQQKAQEIMQTLGLAFALLLKRPQEELEKRKARGEDVGVMAQFSAMKSVMGRLQAEMKKESHGQAWKFHFDSEFLLPAEMFRDWHVEEQELQQKKHGTAFAAGAAKWAEGLDSMEDTPMVQLGDASTAAPFTTRTPSISSVVDIIRQGRCTLLSAVQQMLG